MVLEEVESAGRRREEEPRVGLGSGSEVRRRGLGGSGAGRGGAANPDQHWSDVGGSSPPLKDAPAAHAPALGGISPALPLAFGRKRK